MWYVNIWNSIASILNWLIAGTTLTAVYNYDVKEAMSFPYAVVSAQTWEENILDTASNEIIYWFVIRIIDTNKDIANMETRMRTLVDNVLAELRKKINLTLSWSVIKFLPFTINWGWYDWPQFPVRVCEIKVSIVETFNI